MKPEFYNKGDVRYCKFTIGNINIDAPVAEVNAMVAGLGLLVFAFVTIAIITDSKNNA